MSDEIYAFLKASHLGRINVSQKREHYRRPLALVTSLWCCYKTPRSNHPAEPKRKIPVIILAWYRFLSKRIHKKTLSVFEHERFFLIKRFRIHMVLKAKIIAIILVSMKETNLIFVQNLQHSFHLSLYLLVCA